MAATSRPAQDPFSAQWRPNDVELHPHETGTVRESHASALRHEGMDAGRDSQRHNGDPARACHFELLGDWMMSPIRVSHLSCAVLRL